VPDKGRRTLLPRRPLAGISASSISAYLLRSLIVNLSVLKFPTRSQYLTLIAALAFLPLLTARLSLRLAFLLLGASFSVAPWPALSCLVTLVSLNLDLRRPAAWPAAGLLGPPQTKTLPVARTTQSSAQLTSISIGLPASCLLLPKSLAVGGTVSGGDATAAGAAESGGRLGGGAAASVSTVKLRDAGVGSALPRASVARTSKPWGPSASGAVVWGEAQVENSPASIRHSNVAPASEENPKVGVGSSVGPAGPESMEVSGGAESSM
jgi:hypothetical protein